MRPAHTPRSFALIVLLSTPLGCASTPPPAEPPAGAELSLSELMAQGLAPVEVYPADEPPAFVLWGGTVLTAAGQIHTPGYVVVEGGRVTDVGAGEAPDLPGLPRVDATGGFVTPGLIDTHSHMGVYPWPDSTANSDGNEATDPVTPGVWAEHGFWPEDPGIGWAVAGGITSFQVLPGSANLVGGRGVTLHAVPTRGGRAMRFPGAPETVKMACGENPKRVYGERGRSPSTRMGNLRDLREAFFAAQEYGARWERYERERAAAREAGQEFTGQAPDRDLDRETLLGVLRGEILPHVHCYRADDMLDMIQVSDEMGFRISSFHHALEAYKIRDILAARGIGVSTWADWWGFKMEAWDGIPWNVALVEEAGGIPIMHSDSAVEIQRLNQEAAKALMYGRRVGIDLSEDDALRWVTLNPAKVLGIDHEVGSIEVGKRADLVVWSGSPFSVYSRARWVFIDGALRYDAEAPGAPWSDYDLGREGRP